MSRLIRINLVRNFIRLDGIRKKQGRNGCNPFLPCFFEREFRQSGYFRHLAVENILISGLSISEMTLRQAECLEGLLFGCAGDQVFDLIDDVPERFGDIFGSILSGDAVRFFIPVHSKLVSVAILAVRDSTDAGSGFHFIKPSSLDGIQQHSHLGRIYVRTSPFCFVIFPVA